MKNSPGAEPRNIEPEGKAFPLPPGAIKLYGEKNLKELLSVARDPLLDELDAVFSDNMVAPQDQYEYLELSPHFHELRNRGNTAVSATLAHVRPHLQAVVKAFTENNYKKVEGFLGDLYGLSMLYKLDAGKSPFKGGRVYESFGALIASVTIEFYQSVLALNDQKLLRRFTKIIPEIFNTLNQKFHDRFRQAGFQPFFAISPAKESVHGAQVLSEHVPALNEWTSDVEGDSENELKAEATRLHKEAQQLSSFRELPSVKVTDKKVHIELFGEEYMLRKDKRVLVLSMVHLGFNAESEFKRPTLAKETDELLFHEQTPGNLEFYLDRSSGELCYFTSSVPIAALFRDQPGLYEKLRIKVLRLLIDSLKKEEEHLPIAPAAPMPAVEKLTQELGKSIADQLAEINASKEPHEGVKASSETVSAKNFKGLKGNRVRGILVSLLGEPIRIKGSHHVFKGPNGKPLPIPLGGGEVDPNILRSVLSGWGITDSFLAAYGK